MKALEDAKAELAAAQQAEETAIAADKEKKNALAEAETNLQDSVSKLAQAEKDGAVATDKALGDAQARLAEARTALEAASEAAKKAEGEVATAKTALDGANAEAEKTAQVLEVAQ